MSKLHVYFMPGLAASSLIFERVSLPDSDYKMHYLEWKMPQLNESIQAYATRIAADIKQTSPILVGVSFGGVLVQEISRIIHVRQVIIISSVKTYHEFPLRMRMAKKTKAYKFIPTGLVAHINYLAKYTLGDKLTQRLKLYEKYLSMRDMDYLNWAIDTIINWDRDIADPNVIHIHGDEDGVFPIKYIKDCIVVKGGTHIMILNKFKWLNQELPKWMSHPEKYEQV
jgi:pimeloyl-ACP methyl ester carboxylesterase